jgi:hypothetical protein
MVFVDTHNRTIETSEFNNLGEYQNAVVGNEGMAF